MGYRNSEMGKATALGDLSTDLIAPDVSLTEEDPQLDEDNSADSAPSATSSALCADLEEESCDECCGDSNDAVKVDDLDGHRPNGNVSRLTSLSASKGERGGSSNGGGSDSSSYSASQMVDSLDTEWTDEKHSSYLDSIEASFVRKMYDKQYCALDLCGQAPKRAESSDADSAESRPKFPSPFNEFKVWREGSWQKPTLNRVHCVAVPVVMGGPWTQRFRAPASSKQQAGRLSAVRKSFSNCEKKSVADLEQCLCLPGANCKEVPDLDRALQIWHHRLQSNCRGSTILCGKREPYNIYSSKACIPTDAATDWNFEHEANVERIHGMLPKKQKQSVEGSCSSPNDQVVPVIKSVIAEEVQDYNYHSKVTGTEQQSNDSADLLPPKSVAKHKQLPQNGGNSTRDKFLGDMRVSNGQDWDNDQLKPSQGNTSSW